MLGKKSPHPTAEELGNYCNARVPKERDLAVDAHVAACPRCAQQLQKYQLLRTVLDDFGSRPARPVDHRSVLREALITATKHATQAVLKRRLTAWVAHPAAFAGGVVQWRPGPAGARSKGEVELITAFTGTNGWRLSIQPGEKPPLSPLPPGTAWVEAAAPRKIDIHLFSPCAVSPLVLLAREPGLGAAVIKQTRSHRKQHTQSASFGSLLPGRYLLGLEPLPASGDAP